MVSIPMGIKNFDITKTSIQKPILFGSISILKKIYYRHQKLDKFGALNTNNLIQKKSPYSYENKKVSNTSFFQNVRNKPMP